MLRKIVVVGDRLNTGGIILPNGNSSNTIGDARDSMALIGGSAKCECCNSIGQIAKAGGPRRLNFMGEVALENDIVICKCSEHPRLVAWLHHTVTYDDSAETLGVVPLPKKNISGVFQSAVENSEVNELFDDYYRLIDDRTGQPLSSCDYAVIRENGRVEYGTTSEIGDIHILSSTVRSEVIKIFA